jgi:hypothetical protein
MKILMVGKKQNYNAEFFYEKAFQKLEHEVLNINSYNGVNHELIQRYLHTRTNVFNFLLSNFWINNQIQNIVDKYDPDIILIFKGELLSQQTIERLSQSRNVYLFYPDTFKFKPLIKNRISYYKKVFTASNNKNFYYLLGAKSVVTVPWACDPDFHKRNNISKSYAVTFIGTAYFERRILINNLRNVEVFGEFWFGRRSHKPVYGEEFVNIINKSLINLNLQARISILADAPTMRTFEVAGCGGFQISDYMPSLKQYFPMIPTFKHLADLKDQIAYFLESRDEAAEIANKTMEICYTKYKYTDSAKKILANL